MTRAAIGLGSNLGNSGQTLAHAVRRLGEFGRVAAVSSLYRTEPWGVEDQPPFLNAAAIIETAVAPHQLLAALKRLEIELGREPSYRWGPRAIDLDILYYGSESVDEPELQIPHPRLTERAFALEPLAEIDHRYRKALEALPLEERRKVKPLREGEWVALMSDEQLSPESASADLIGRVRALATAFLETDLVRLRIEERNEDAVEFRRTVPVAAPEADETAESAVSEPARGRVDAIKSDLVGIIRLGRPVPAEGELLQSDRELGYVEALGIRTGVRSLGPGRIVGVRIEEGQPVEYGQVLFEIDRG